jgi:lipoprotein-releasing system permease protein
MSYKFFIAKRYLISKKETSFITLISLISVIGVTVGVAALVVVLSVFNGFDGLVTSLLVGFDPHIRITGTEKTTGTDLQKLAHFISDNRDVQGACPFVSGKAMIVSKDQSKVVFVRGLEPSEIDKVCGLKQKMILGHLQLGDSTQRSLVLGLTLSDRLGAVTGDSVMLISPAGSEQALLGFGAPVVRYFRVAGVYESDNRDYDELYAYMSLRSAQVLFQLGNQIQGYELRLHDIGDSNKFKEEVQQLFPGDFQVQTWYDLHKDLYSVMKIERWTAYIILCLIIGVATFNLLGSLTMSVIAKTRDIGILKAMGAANRDIVSVFRFEGLIVGIVGTIIGSILGLFVCWMQIRFHLFPLDPTVYIIPAIPVQVRLTDFVAVGFASIGLCYVATLIPSKRAADLLPSEAIRWE